MKFSLISVLFLFFLHSSLFSQSPGQLFESKRYESVIHSYANSGQSQAKQLAVQDLTLLARAHLERARLVEQAYHFSLRTASQYVRDAFEDEIQESGLDLLGSRAAQYSNTGQTTNMPRSGNPFSTWLQQWHRNGMHSMDCTGETLSAPFCTILNALSDESSPEYSELAGLFHDVEIPGGAELINRLVARDGDAEKFAEIEEWLNLLQLHYIVDYSLSSLLFEEAGRTELSPVPASKARLMKKFNGEFDGNLSGQVDYYRWAGHQVARNRICPFSEWPGGLMSMLQNGGQSAQVGLLIIFADAVKVCSPGDTFREYIAPRLTEISPPNDLALRYISSSLVQFQFEEAAFDVVDSIKSRRVMFDMEANEPEVMVLHSYLKFHRGGDENWRDARQLMFILQEEFEAITPAWQLLRLATNSEYRSSINTIIE
jgi:hypothetical protein